MGLFSSKKSQTTRTEIPSWLESGSQLAVDKAKSISDREYTPYTNDRVAGLSEGETQAKNLALDATRSGKAMGYLDQAGAELNKQTEFSGQNLAKYMNPYVDQVVNNTISKQQGAYGQERANLGATAATAGAFGGDRQAILESQLSKNNMDKVSDITSKGYSDAFNNATSLWQADNNRRVQSAAALSQVGGDVQRLTSQQVSDLAATGQVDRLLSQANMDFDYQQFIENRDWDVNNLQPLIATLSSVPHSSSQTTESSGGGGLGSILGAIGSMVGAYYGGGVGGGAGGMFGGAGGGGGG